MTWGIIGALDTEVALIKKKMQVRETKTIMGCEYNIGVAGALHPSLKILDVVISENVILHDADLHILKNYYPFREDYKADPKLIELCRNACERIENRSFQVHTGRIASGDRFIEDKAVKADIIERFSPWCVEMEGASVGQVAYMNDTPFLIIRSISDNADDGAYEVYDNFVDLAAHNSAQIVLNMMALYTE